MLRRASRFGLTMPARRATSQHARPERRPTGPPAVLALVFGVFLVLIGITAAALSGIVAGNVANANLAAVAEADAGTIRAFVNAYVQPTDLTVGLPAARATTADAQLAALASRDELLTAEIRLVDGARIAAASAAERPNPDAVIAPELFQSAAAGTPTLAMADRAGPPALVEYLPVISAGAVKAGVGLERGAAPLVARLDAVRRDVIGVTIGAAVVAAFVLFLLFRSTQARITRQQAALLDAARRDGVTGLPNHGAIVAELTKRVEAARDAGTAVGIALVDIDNFRLLNETYGHEAGDDALRAVATELVRVAAADLSIGRFGPDEFVVVADAPDIGEIHASVGRLRHALVDVSLRFEDSERLPLTISAGIATLPEHASSVTELLSAASIALGEARSSGGDAMRDAAPPSTDAGARRTFDVLQGLVIAIDTKDRYTKRHSEDVSRYATFIAGLIGLDDETRRCIRVAGLLHDVGKIGIPDAILRKPGKLTADEMDIVRQHVALGDAIIRDLPGLDLVRAGVRHHHERWDGDGYLHRLAGEDIPLIARILSVADAFSAMTTTRPYRKALPLREALRRLEDAAGTQLDEALVIAFVDGIENSVDAPLPGSTAQTASLWTPVSRVA